MQGLIFFEGERFDFWRGLGLVFFSEIFYFQVETLPMAMVLNVGFTRALCVVLQGPSPGILGTGGGDSVAERCKAKKTAVFAARGGGGRTFDAEQSSGLAMRSPGKNPNKYSEKQRVYSAPAAPGL